MADMRYCPQCKRMVNAQGSGSKKAAVAFGILGWGISRALNKECPICGTKLEYKTEQEYNNLGKEVVPKKLSNRCGNCKSYLGADCPRQYAIDSEIWRQQDPCDLYEQKNKKVERNALSNSNSKEETIEVIEHAEKKKRIIDQYRKNGVHSPEENLNARIIVIKRLEGKTEQQVIDEIYEKEFP